MLDTPLIGLNPHELSTIKAIIKMLGEIKTVVISSRSALEVADLCSKVALLSNGELLAFASPDELAEMEDKESVEIEEEIDESTDESLEEEVE